MTAFRVAFAGTPEFSLPALQALLDSPHELVGVLTQPDRPAGRGRKLTASLVKQLAESRGVAVFQPDTLRSESAQQRLRSWQLDVLVVVAYGLILPPAVLALPSRACLNIHASLLPRWRGAAPIQRAILAGDRETGVMIMQMEAGLDTGPIFATRRVPIDATATAGELQAVLARAGAAALLEVLAQLQDGSAESQAQDTTGVRYALKIAKSEAPIDWQASAAQIDRQIRAFNPWPVATAVFGDQLLRLHRSRVLPAMPDSLPARPGAVLGLAGDCLRVACGAGQLGLLEVQLAGRRVVAAREFEQAHALAGKVLQ